MNLKTMFKKTFTTLWMLLLTVGVIFPNFYSSLFDTFKFGATNFPTSLDTLTNPAGTDSVATVSHSGQHSNANDAIEAIEAKVGIGASTPLSNTVFVGNGTGISLFSTYATGTSFYGTNLTSTGLSTFGSFLSLSSSTITGGLHITGNSTTTNATTTRFAMTAFSDQIPYANASGSFIPLTIGTGLLLSGGTLSNSSPAGATTLRVATSSSSANLTIGPISVVAGDEFLLWGKGGTDNNGDVILEYKQGTETASTTLDSSHRDNNGSYDDNLAVHGYFIATTTTTVIFDIRMTAGQSGGGWSSLIIQPF